MTKLHDLPSTKTLSDEDMESVHGGRRKAKHGLVLTRKSLRRRPTASSRFTRYGIIRMNGIIGDNNTFGRFGLVRMNG